MRLQGVCKTGGPIATLQPTPTRAAGPDDDIAALVAEAPPSTAAQIPESRQSSLLRWKRVCQPQWIQTRQLNALQPGESPVGAPAWQ